MTGFGESPKAPSPTPTFSEIPIIVGRNYSEHLLIKAEREVQVKAFELAMCPDTPEAALLFQEKVASLSPYALGELATMVSETYNFGIIGQEPDPESDSENAKRGIALAMDIPDDNHPRSEVVHYNGMPIRVVYEAEQHDEYNRRLAHAREINMILMEHYIDIATSYDGRSEQYEFGVQAVFFREDPQYFLKKR